MSNQNNLQLDTRFSDIW